MTTRAPARPAGSFVFALSGAVAGAKHRRDPFEGLVSSFVATKTGGIVRDVSIGTARRGAIRTCPSPPGLTFCFSSRAIVRWNPLQWFDAAGLALSGVTGAHALGRRLSP